MAKWEALTEDGPVNDVKHPDYVNGVDVPLRRPTKREIIEVLMYTFCADKYASRRVSEGVYEINFHDGMAGGEWSGEIRVQTVENAH